MAEFQYNAIDRDGRPATGRVEADDVQQALAQLSQQGLSAGPEDVVLLGAGSDDQLGDVILIANDLGEVDEHVGTTNPEPSFAADGALPLAAAGEEPAPHLSERETNQLVESVVDLTSLDLPLSAGLRAAAEEVPQRRVARAMRRLASELDRGVTLDVALGSASQNIPSHLRGLIFAGLRTGRVAHVLEELVAMDRERVDLRRRVVAALAYPTILCVLLMVSFVFANLFVVQPFSRIFDEFGVELPPMTVMTISTMRWFDTSGLWTVLILVGILLPSFVILMYVPKAPELQRACYRFPMLGPMWKWQSLVDFSRLMYLLLDRQVPMAEALRLTADGLRWSDLAEVSRACATDIEKGMGLPESMAKYRDFPASIRPVINSGMKAQQPAQAFEAAADMYRRRAGVDATLWEAILPPVILVIVAVGVSFLVISMFLPLIKLISSLT